MDRTSNYYRQVQLLVQIIPFVAEQKCFALKGGTAINLFVRNLPRLSVDIDLVYLPMKERDEALAAHTAAHDPPLSAGVFYRNQTRILPRLGK